MTSFVAVFVEIRPPTAPRLPLAPFVWGLGSIGGLQRLLQPRQALTNSSTLRPADEKQEQEAPGASVAKPQSGGICEAWRKAS